MAKIVTKMDLATTRISNVHRADMECAKQNRRTPQHQQDVTFKLIVSVSPALKSVVHLESNHAHTVILQRGVQNLLSVSASDVRNRKTCSFGWLERNR
jgi:hypothetical protein